MELCIFSSEIHWLDLIVHIIIWPIFLLAIRYSYFRWRYRKIIGKYKGGESLLEINLRFLCVFKISCTEAGGQFWEGKSYKVNDEGNYLTGLFVWNPHQKKIPDIGQHHLYFSEDRDCIKAHWEKLTGLEGHEGMSDWIKRSKN